ncbi:hypothetical protein E2C01_021517 [Portunus trituberculatus]|uniref:Uncharacterized protein n=1 Tax=Portunus trituberculatus TaxID=210409 RepID=A0A5B7E554_PORTR|nr:hypothetical protein [Portunus trituberculatus]
MFGPQRGSDLGFVSGVLIRPRSRLQLRYSHGDAWVIHFGHVRLGTKVLYQVVEDKVRNSTYAYMYRSLDNLILKQG